MLVLSRKVGEKIVINNNITLTVVAVDGHRVRLGIDAPGDVRVMRSELLDGAGASDRCTVSAARRAAELALGR